MSVRRSQRRGQGMTEVIITVALVAIGTIAATTLFGNNVRRLFGVSSDNLAAQESGNRGVKAGKSDRGMKNFASSSGGEGSGSPGPQAANWGVGK